MHTKMISNHQEYDKLKYDRSYYLIGYNSYYMSEEYYQILLYKASDKLKRNM